MQISKELIAKYDQQAPRYTSYPPVPFWSGPPTEQLWFEHLLQNYNSELGADLYLHIPFCEKLCYYCGCHRTIKKNKVGNASFVSTLIKEWNLYQQKIENLFAHSIHLGGGTPTFLKPDELDDLLGHLVSGKPLALGSVEVDPRTTSLEHLDIFKKYGLNRLSMGIQDFDLEVQREINREQSFELVSTLVDEVRQRQFESINFDLIYGLPKQTLKSIEETVQKVLSLAPDMVAFYSYAHVPWKISNQKLIKTELMPSSHDKHLLYLKLRELFLNSDYVEIGIDHFAKKGSPLERAQANAALMRNFMGYTDVKSPTLIGLGPSSISSSRQSFIQNQKDLKTYTESIEIGRLAIQSGHIHTSEDQSVDDIIQNIMCNGRWNSSLDQFAHQVEMKNELKAMIDDQLIVQEGDHYLATETGRFLLRNIAKIYDHHLRLKTGQNIFSRTL